MDNLVRDRLKNFKTFGSEPNNQIVIRCRNRYGSYAYFQDHDGVIRIGFGTEDGFEPDKDAIAFDKKDLPEVLAFLDEALRREVVNG